MSEPIFDAKGEGAGEALFFIIRLWDYLFVFAIPAVMSDIRKIIHVDMDAFFASVEQRDNPALRGRPVAVGSASPRGVVAAASYEARAFGVKSAMPSSRALRQCPDLIFVPHRFDVYRAVSRQIREIFAQHTDNKQGIGSAVKIAKMIRADIQAETGLTASAGVSYNKFIAKLASDQNKPDGLCVILPNHGAEFVASLPIRRFHGIGPRTAEKMARLGIANGSDLCMKDEGWMLRNFGSWGSYLYLAARGIDHRPVNPNQIRKSLSGELTYSVDKITEGELRSAIEEIIEIVWERICRYRAQGRTLTLKVRFADFRTVTRSRSLDHIIAERDEFSQLSHQLIDQLLPITIGVRLLGLTLSGLVHDDETRRGIAEQAVLPFG